MFSTFLDEDVTLLLKDITGMVQPLSTKERELLIQQGVHYCEMLPIEYKPTDEYLLQYQNALDAFSQITADAVAVTAEKIIEAKGKNAVLISLARAGTPIGILIKRYLKNKYMLNIPHYSISIIRGMGIDDNAMRFILKSHAPQDLQFIDGWTGKGAILNELKKQIQKYPNVSSELAVLADPANITKLCGTHDDFLIASSCLNSTVCGLISRTFYKKSVIRDDDFHGAAFYKELSDEDRTYEFINKIERCFNYNISASNREMQYSTPHSKGIDEVRDIACEFDVDNINFIKPGVGETTRVLLRRVPEIVLIRNDEYSNPIYINHILRLADEKNVKIVKYNLKNYRACGIIKNLSADL